MSSLPRGWAFTPVSHIATYNPKTEALENTESAFSPMQYLGTNFRGQLGFEIKTWGDIKKAYTHFKNGDVLMAKVTPCFENGKAGIATNLPNGIGAGSSEFMVFRPTAAVINRYLLGWLSTQDFRRRAAVAMTGSVGLKRVPKDFVLEEKIPLAPLSEQQRIADKLEVTLARVDSCCERLARVAPIIKRFRQSVLAAAMSGQLTTEWREHRGNSPTENLVKRPRCDEDASKIDASSILNVADDLAAAKKARGFVAKKIEATNNHELVTEHFASEWAVTDFDTLFDFIDYRGKTPIKSNSGIRLITAKNIKMGYLQDSPVEFLSISDYESWMTRGYPKKGDILFVTEGHTMGCVALNTRSDRFALAQRTITLQPLSTINSKFYFYYMLSNRFQKLVELNATGTAAMGIKASKLRGLPVPFPSFDEQLEISRQVEALFAFADRLEMRLAKAVAASERLTPSLLAKAFRGELVPQDPNDEPAGELLRRLAAQRETATIAKRAKKIV